MRPALIVYAVVIALVASLIAAGVPRGAAFVTVRALAQNHRITAGDIKPAPGYRRFLGPFSPTAGDFVGQYLAAPAAANAEVNRGLIRAQPRLTAPPGSFALWLPFEDTAEIDRNVLDVGSRVDVCGVLVESGACLENLAVAAIVCGTEKTPAPCALGIWTPTARRGAILAALDRASAPANVVHVHVLLRYTGDAR